MQDQNLHILFYPFSLLKTMCNILCIILCFISSTVQHDIIFLIDDSESMREFSSLKTGYIHDVTDFIRSAVDSTNYDYCDIGITAFSDTTRELTPLSSNKVQVLFRC